MIQAVIFDCFGVLAKDSWLPFRQRYFANQPELFKQATVLNQQVDAGLLNYDTFIHQVADLAGISHTSAAEQIEHNPADDELLAYIATLKPNYRIGMLSNAGDDWLGELFTPAQIALFDEIVLSYQIGAIKPDRRMYEVIIAKLGVEPNECLFVDDRKACIEGAQAIGMQGILYQDFTQFKSDLEALL